MPYDFTSVPDRKNVGSFKYADMFERNPDVPDGIIPLSTADMEFYNAPEIREGLKEFIDHMVLGYTAGTDGFYDAVVDWMRRRHDYEIKKKWIAISDGVVPAIGDLIRCNSEEGDGVLITSPVYYPFAASILANNRKVVDVPLLLTEHGYELDYDGIEAAAKAPSTKLMIFCNPHNPVGRVWTKEELEKILTICIENDVYIIDDEIHHDLIMPGYKHTVMATLRPDAGLHMAVCTAPSKSFNLAGMQTSSIIIECPERRKAFVGQREKSFRLMLNILGYEACRLAYTRCEAWLEECIDVIDSNAKYIEAFLKEHMPEVKAFPLEGTYLQWYDFSAWGLTPEALEQFMVKEALIFSDEVYVFGKTGEGFERLNLACPRSVVEATMDRLLAARNRCITL